MDVFSSNGKLLISGEYLVLDGACSLALPTRFGQLLKVRYTETQQVVWKSYRVDKACWFSSSFELSTLKIERADLLKEQDVKVANTLKKILQTAKHLNPQFLKNSKGVEVCTELTFPNEWGLGTSSTLINSIASWAKVNAFELLEHSFGGSGYDIACAQTNHPITYQRNGIAPVVENVNFNPSFKDQLFFVYLNQKQDSKEGIKMYRSLTVDKNMYIEKINQLTQKMILATDIESFESLITKHEHIIAKLLGIEPIKTKQFSTFKGAIKSLGAWGGDFVLVTGQEKEVLNYFKPKGFTTILTYEEMILS